VDGAYVPTHFVGMYAPVRIGRCRHAKERHVCATRELGHQVGVFSADLFDWINGAHSLKVLENCFKDLHL
jgi:hypothetical protein